MINIDLANETSSEKFAEQWAKNLKKPLVLGFSGEIGTGKTTFIRALFKALGVKAAIKSPTFSLIESYFTSSFIIHHFDLYRIKDEDELEYLGFRDYFTPEAICCIEWPEKAPQSMAMLDLLFTLSIKEKGRGMNIQFFTSLGKNMLDTL